MRRFLVCVHDASPAYARETGTIVRQLAPLVGRHLTVGVVPNWHGEWPLTEHPEFCRLVRRNSSELLIHGYFHQRQRGLGPISILTGRSDEMNGLNLDETRRTIERAQQEFDEAFGATARGFLAPGWQRGHVSVAEGSAFPLEYVLGFFSLESAAGRTVPLATFAWDCGRWGWLGHVGQGIGRLLHSLDGRVPVLAIHPRDLERGFWPKVRQIAEELLQNGYEPSTMAALLEASGGQVVS